MEGEGRALSSKAARRPWGRKPRGGAGGASERRDGSHSEPCSSARPRAPRGYVCSNVGSDARVGSNAGSAPRDGSGAAEGPVDSHTPPSLGRALRTRMPRLLAGLVQMAWAAPPAGRRGLVGGGARGGRRHGSLSSHGCSTIQSRGGAARHTAGGLPFERRVVAPIGNLVLIRQMSKWSPNTSIVEEWCWGTKRVGRGVTDHERRASARVARAALADRARVRGPDRYIAPPHPTRSTAPRSPVSTATSRGPPPPAWTPARGVLLAPPLTGRAPLSPRARVPVAASSCGAALRASLSRPALPVAPHGLAPAGAWPPLTCPFPLPPLRCRGRFHCPSLRGPPPRPFRHLRCFLRRRRRRRKHHHLDPSRGGQR